MEHAIVSAQLESAVKPNWSSVEASLKPAVVAA